MAMLAATPLFAEAQTASDGRIGRIGVMGGVNIAKLTGDNFDDVDSRIGPMVGLSYVRYAPGGLGFEIDALYSAKGVKDSEEGADITFKLNYLELPLLARYDFKSASSTRVHLVAGPSLALRAGCSIEGKAEGVDVSLDCDDVAETFDGEISSFDVGLTAGGGVDFAVGRNTFTLGARFTQGLLNIADGDGDAKNRTISVFAGVSMPLRR